MIPLKEKVDRINKVEGDFKQEILDVEIPAVLILEKKTRVP